MSDNAIEPAIKAPSPARIAAGQIICDDTQWTTIKKTSSHRGQLDDAGLEGATTDSWRGIGIRDDKKSQAFAAEIIKILNEAAGGELEEHCVCWIKKDEDSIPTLRPSNIEYVKENPHAAKYDDIVIRKKILDVAKEQIQGQGRIYSRPS